MTRFLTRIRPWRADRTAVAVAVIAVVVLVPGIFWGTPHATSETMVRGWDVDGIAGMNVLAELHNLLVEPKPDWYTAYPLFHYLVLAACYAPYLALQLLTGSWSGPTATYPFGFSDPIATFAVLSDIARLVTLGMAVGTVLVAYATARILWDRRAALVAAIAVLLAGPMVYYARTSNLDVPALFWTALALMIAVTVAAHGMTVRRAVLLGGFSALAVATKDQAYGALLPCIVAVLVQHARGNLREDRRIERRGFRATWGAPLVLLLTGLSVYAIANGVVFWPHRFASHVRFITGFEDGFFNLQHATWMSVLRPATPMGLLLLLGDLARATVVAVGPLLPLIGMAGVLLAWHDSRPSRILVWAGIGFVVLTLFPIRHMQYRYTLPVLYPLSLFAGFVVSRTLSRARGVATAAATAVVAGALLIPTASGVELVYQMVRDARYAAGDCIATAVPPGDTMGYFGVRHQLPHMPAGVRPVELTADESTLKSMAGGAPEYVLVAPDYFSDSTRTRSTFLPESVFQALNNGTLGYRLVATFRTAPLICDWIGCTPLRYLPYVNPQVRVYHHSVAPSSALATAIRDRPCWERPDEHDHR